jgi:hypothetical protein
MLEPPGDGELGELTGDGVKITDVLVIPRDPDALGKLGVGWGEGFVTTDEQAAAVTNDDTNAKQEPWQPGLTTGRMEQTPYQTDEVAEQTRRAVEAMREHQHNWKHQHNWIPTGSFDTGHNPVRQRWDCPCGESVWTDDPEGPGDDD